MNKQLLSIVLLLSIIPATSIFAEQQSILPDRCVVEEHDVWVAADREFVITTQFPLDSRGSMGQEWALCKHGELELIDYDCLISKPIFNSFGIQTWTFKASHPGNYTFTFKRNSETKTVSVYAFHDWCGTEPQINTPIITF